MSKRIEFKVEGTVQGVGFRQYVEKQAKPLNLTGFVKNESDGTVGGEAQGESSSLEKFVQHLNKGPSSSEVNKVDQKEISTKQGETGFGSH